jgi:hypothetical protein
MAAPKASSPGSKKSRPKDPVEDFDAFSQALAEHAYGVMRLYCIEHQLKKEHVVHAVARMCVSLRESYPDGAAKFDELAAEAQARMEQEGRT